MWHPFVSFVSNTTRHPSSTYLASENSECVNVSMHSDLDMSMSTCPLRVLADPTASALPVGLHILPSAVRTRPFVATMPVEFSTTLKSQKNTP